MKRWLCIGFPLFFFLLNGDGDLLRQDLGFRAKEADDKEAGRKEQGEARGGDGWKAFHGRSLWLRGGNHSKTT